MQLDPKNKNVLITGAARGIGYKTAKYFARNGSRLLLTDLDGEALQKAEDDLGSVGTVLDTYSVDVSNQEGVEEMAEDVLDHYNKLDVLINNAGIPHHEEFTETSIEEWKTIFGVNFFGPLYHIYAFLPDMMDRNQGHIVNISSGQAFFLIPTWGAYATSKLALSGFSEVLHHELKKHDIGVTTVYPYVVNTGFYSDVGIESVGSKLSMKLLEFYAHSPDDVAQQIYEATINEKKSEMSSLLNWMGFYMDFIPGAKSLFTDFVRTVMTR